MFAKGHGTQNDFVLLPDLNADDLRLHIDACEHCLDEVDVVAALKKIVHRSCAGAHAPDSLRLRIMTEVTQVTYRTITWQPGTA